MTKIDIFLSVVIELNVLLKLVVQASLFKSSYEGLMAPSPGSAVGHHRND